MTDETPNTTAPDPQPSPAAPEPGASRPVRATSADTRPRRPDYRGEELDPERGPGLGCFWFQVIVLGFFIVLIPIGLELNWPFELLALLLFIVIGLLLLTGQSVIFLLRLVAADRRSQGRRRPLASSTKTVGELEDEQEVTLGAEARAAEVERAPADAAAQQAKVEAEPAVETTEAEAEPAAEAETTEAEAEPTDPGFIDAPGPTEEAAPGADDGAPPPDLPADPAPDLPPDQASSEEPGAGVRQ